MERKNIVVIGVGRIGAVTAVGMAHLLHRVVGIDTNPARIAALGNGDLAESEPGLRSALRSALRFRDIQFGGEVDPGTCDVAFLCVDTPSTANGSADIRQLEAAAASAVHLLRFGGALVTRSTSPPGTCDRLAGLLASAGRPDVAVAHVPEFLREGRCWEDFRQPERIVVGCDSGPAAERIAGLFAGIEAPVILTTARTAELAKYSANAFLATSVSFANELAELGSAVGADMAAVFEVLRSDSRIGRGAYLTPGLGFGGHCLPKDTEALRMVGESAGIRLPQLEATIAVNNQQVHRTVAWLVQRLGELQGKRIAVCGLTFKPDTDDLRSSQALRLARLLGVMGAEVAAYDSGVSRPVDGVCLHNSLLGAVQGADGLVVAHPAVSFETAPETLAPVMRRRLLYDAPGRLALEPWRAAGFDTNRPTLPVPSGVEAGA